MEINELQRQLPTAEIGSKELLLEPKKFKESLSEDEGRYMGP
ncbi:hypothetical protein [Peribacillus simplex]|nr:hypothetical protein [Peribacillus simplex]